PLTVRLAAVAALADVVRLLVFPLTLRVDYSPNERTAVTSPLDFRFAIGLLCALTWAALLLLAWRRGRKLEAFGLGWIGVAFLPVANLLYPRRGGVRSGRAASGRLALGPARALLPRPRRRRLLSLRGDGRAGSRLSGAGRFSPGPRGPSEGSVTCKVRRCGQPGALQKS